jgi:TetR/AcrR family transcriptional regulator, repressor for divergent bdcA
VTTKKRVKRGRPRGFDVDEAIAIATDLFHRRGYDDIGVAELSAKMGITAPSLYSAFGSKRELFERSLQHYVQTNSGWMPAALATGDSLEIGIYNLFVRAAGFYSIERDRPGCLVLDGTRNCGDVEVRSLTAVYRRGTWQFICSCIQAGAPDLSSAQAESLADYALTILIGLSSSARDGIATDVLKASAKIAALGFAQQLDAFIPDRKMVE